MSLLYKLLGVAALLGAAWWVWDGDRDRFAAAAVKAAVDPIIAEAKRVKAERDQLAKDKAALVIEAEGLFNEREGARKERDEANRLLAVARRAVVERVRATRVDPGSRRVDTAAADTCSAEHRQLDERIDELLQRGQWLAIEGAELVAECGSLVDRGETGLGKAASLIELANDWGRAVRLGERP